jgi:hypothetical protein
VEVACSSFGYWPQRWPDALGKLARTTELQRQFHDHFAAADGRSVAVVPCKSQPFSCTLQTGQEAPIIVLASRELSFEEEAVSSCGDWQAPRLPVFPIGDVNPPCSFLSNSLDLPVADNAVLSTLTIRPGFVEFQTNQGKKVTASW